jgi:chromosome segregation ATPase
MFSKLRLQVRGAWDGGDTAETEAVSREVTSGQGDSGVVTSRMVSSGQGDSEVVTSRVVTSRQGDSGMATSRMLTSMVATSRTATSRETSSSSMRSQAGGDLVRWQLATEAELREKEKRLRTGQELAHSQKKQIVGLRGENEKLATELSRTGEENAAVGQNLAATKEEVELMARQLSIVSGQIRLVEEDRSSALTMQEERTEQLVQMEESFRQLQVSHQVKIRRSHEEVTVTESEVCRSLREVKEAVEEAEKELKNLEHDHKDQDGENDSVAGELNDAKKERKVKELHTMDNKKKLEELLGKNRNIERENNENKIRVDQTKVDFQADKRNKLDQNMKVEEHILLIEDEISNTKREVGKLQVVSSENDLRLEKSISQLSSLQEKEKSLRKVSDSKDEQIKQTDHKIQKLKETKEAVAKTKHKLEKSKKEKNEAEFVLASLKVVQKEKFAQEEARVRLGGRVHVLVAEVEKLEEEIAMTKTTVVTKTEELRKVKANSQSLSVQKGEFNSKISKLQVQLRFNEEELSKASLKSTDQEMSIEKTKAKIVALLTSKASTEEVIKQQNVAKKEVLAKLAVEEKELNSITATNNILKAQEIELVSRQETICRETFEVQQNIAFDETKLKVGEIEKQKVMKRSSELKKEKEEKETVLEASNNKGIQLNEEKQKNMNKIDVLEAQKIKLETELKETNQKQEELNNSRALNLKTAETILEAKKMSKELKLLKNKIVSSCKRKEKLGKQLEKNKRTVDKFVFDRKKSEMELKKMEEEINVLETEIGDKKKEIENQNEEFQTTVNSLESKKNEVEMLKEAIKQLKENKEKAERETENKTKEASNEHYLILKSKRSENEEIMTKMKEEISKFEKSLVSLEKELISKTAEKEKFHFRAEEISYSPNKAEAESKSLDNELLVKDAAILKAQKALISAKATSRRVPDTPVMVQPSPFRAFLKPPAKSARVSGLRSEVVPAPDLDCIMGLSEMSDDSN